MKRNTLYTLLLVTVLSLLTSASAMAQSIVFKAQNVDATPGSTATISVDLEASVPIYSVKFTISLPEGFSYVATSSEDDEVLYGMVSTARKPSTCMQKDVLVSANKVTFGLVSTSRIKKDSGTLVTFRAKLPSNVSLGSYPIEITNIEATGADSDLSANVSVQTGKINVVKPVYTVQCVANANGKVTVSPASSTSSYEEGTLLTLTATPNQGYEFSGWSTGSKENPLKVTVTGNATYTASFTAKTYKATFIIDGQTITKEVAYGSQIPVPTVSEKTGYTFTGWDATVPSTMPAQDLTFTAQWKVNTYKLVFNTGSQTISNDVAYGAAIKAPADPTKTGYSFEGWDATVPATMPAQDLTFNAVWKVLSYKAIFICDQDTTITAVPYGSKITVPSVAPKTGYTFTGWNASVPATMPASDLTFVAQWKVNTYKLIFNTGSQTFTSEVAYGSAIAAPAVGERDGYVFEGWDETVPTTMPAKDLTFVARWRAILYKLTYTVGDVTMVYQIPCGSTIALPATLTRTGYTFAGWDNTLPTTMPAGDLAVTAQWNANTYKVTYKDGDEVLQTYTVECGAAVPEPEVLSRPGYSFLGWNDRVPTTMPASDLIFTAQWEAHQYPVIFLSSDSILSQQLLEVGAAIEASQDPELEGYTFCGWDPDFVSGATAPVGGAIYKAIFKVNPYTITYVVDGETYATQGYTFEETVTPVADPEKEGYTFTGWDAELPATMPAENLTFTAQWQINQYKVTFLAADGSVIAEQTQDYGSVITAPEAPEREGYTFQGWSPEVDAVVPTRDCTYEATYTVNTYKVSYYYGDVLLYEEEVAYGSPMPEYVWQPGEDNIIFNGWVGEQYESMPAHDVTYTADFTDVLLAPAASASAPVYTLGGVQVRATSSLKGLPSGVYVVGGKKIIKK